MCHQFFLAHACHCIWHMPNARCSGSYARCSEAPPYLKCPTYVRPPKCPSSAPEAAPLQQCRRSFARWCCAARMPTTCPSGRCQSSCCSPSSSTCTLCKRARVAFSFSVRSCASFQSMVCCVVPAFLSRRTHKCASSLEGCVWLPDRVLPSVCFRTRNTSACLHRFSFAHCMQMCSGFPTRNKA